MFHDQCDDSLHVSILASISSLLSPSHEAPSSVPSSSSLGLKALLNKLKYTFLDPNESFPLIIANDLNLGQENQVLDFLRENKKALGRTLGSIRGINPTIVQHRIYLEDNARPYLDRERRLNPNLQEVVRKEILKWLDHEFMTLFTPSWIVSE